MTLLLPSYRLLQRACAGLVLGVVLGTLTLRGATPALPPLQEGVQLLERGRFNEALPLLEKAHALARSQSNAGDEEAAALFLAQSLQTIGRYRKATLILEELAQRATASTNGFRLTLIRGRLAAARILTRELPQAEKELLEVLQIERSQPQSALLPSLLNEYGNLLAVQSRFEPALQAYRESAALADASTQLPLAAEAWLNAALVSSRIHEPKVAASFTQESLSRNQRRTPSHAQGVLWIKAGQIQLQLAQRSTPERQDLLGASRDSFQKALQLAEETGMVALKSLSYGNMARLYEEDGQTEAALQLARQAIFAAQQSQSPETLYQWEWIVARLLTRQGQIQQGLAAYRNAAQTLQSVRHDLSIGHGNSLGSTSFRQGEGTLFVELTDLLLKTAGASSDRAAQQKLLSEARDTIEMLKSVELESYWCDECADLVRSKGRAVETIDPQTAVLYVIPLPDRTELLVGLHSGLQRTVVSIQGQVLEEEVRTFRHLLETRTSYEFLDPARKLYDHLIRPIRPLLTTNDIHTLVIVPDGAMRTIPFAALHDGQRFLIEELAVAVVPGLSLVEPKALEAHQSRLLLSGLSRSVQGFAPLDHVPEELQNIQSSFAGDTLLNEGFTSAQLQSRLTGEQYSVVHIASHGKFDSDVRNTFVLTYDGRLTLDHLEALIRPSQYRGRPVELLVLSACQTAAGDDRAALGLAGVAIKAGARSALATLWFVNDQSTSTLVTGLYDQLKRNPGISKARALQAAQIQMLNDRRFFHPCYWSPYLLIGNWL